MPEKKYRIPYAESYLEFSLPPACGHRGPVTAGSTHSGCAGRHCRGPGPPHWLAAAAGVGQARPAGMHRLHRRTRSSPDQLLVPALLGELEKAGCGMKISPCCAGWACNRPSSLAEKKAKLGEAVVRRYRVIDNEPQNPAALVDLEPHPAECGAGAPGG